jgi:hypothetical protein
MGNKYTTGLFGICFIATLASACGESGDDGAGDGTGGAATGGASSGTGAASASGGMTDRGGASSATGGASGAIGGTSSSGASGVSGSGAGGTGGDEVCGGLTRNGRCVDNVYEWCDYFTGGIARLDCTPLGGTCRALATQSFEEDVNGCVTGPCTGSDDGCDGSLVRDCEGDGVVVNDCRKFDGPDSTCELDGTSAHCTHPTCTTPRVSSCDGDFRLICDEGGALHVEDCARCNATGTCVLGDPMSADGPAQCTEFSWGCE